MLHPAHVRTACSVAGLPAGKLIKDGALVEVIWIADRESYTVWLPTRASRNSEKRTVAASTSQCSECASCSLYCLWHCLFQAEVTVERVERNSG